MGSGHERLETIGHRCVLLERIAAYPNKCIGELSPWNLRHRTT